MYYMDTKKSIRSWVVRGVRRKDVAPVFLVLLPVLSSILQEEESSVASPLVKRAISYCKEIIAYDKKDKEYTSEIIHKLLKTMNRLVDVLRTKELPIAKKLAELALRVRKEAGATSDAVYMPPGMSPGKFIAPYLVDAWLGIIGKIFQGFTYLVTLIAATPELRDRADAFVKWLGQKISHSRAKAEKLDPKTIASVTEKVVSKANPLLKKLTKKFAKVNPSAESKVKMIKFSLEKLVEAAKKAKASSDKYKGMVNKGNSKLDPYRQALEEAFMKRNLSSLDFFERKNWNNQHKPSVMLGPTIVMPGGKKDSRYRDSRLKRTVKRPSKRATAWEIRTVLGMSQDAPLNKSYIGTVSPSGDVEVTNVYNPSFRKWMSATELDHILAQENLSTALGFKPGKTPGSPLAIPNWTGPIVSPQAQQKIEASNMTKVNSAITNLARAAQIAMSVAGIVGGITTGATNMVKAINKGVELVNNGVTSLNGATQQFKEAKR